MDDSWRPIVTGALVSLVVAGGIHHYVRYVGADEGYEAHVHRDFIQQTIMVPPTISQYPIAYPTGYLYPLWEVV